MTGPWIDLFWLKFAADRPYPGYDTLWPARGKDEGQGQGEGMMLAASAQIAPGTAARTGLEGLTARVADDLRDVNRLIVDRMHSPVGLIPQLAGHIIAAGGKRLRPILTLASAQLCGYRGRRHLTLAACVEFIHTATLLHDDVVDQSDLRRGLSTANSVWGNQPSVLVGDFLFSRAFQFMVADGSLEVLKILSDASAVIAEGEVQQLMTTNDTTTGEDDYLSVIGAKTAALFAAACQIGAVVAERPEAEELALGTYGRNFGIAFQLVDDILDFSARQAEAERERRGKVIAAQGELQASSALAEAASVLAKEPIAIQLRYLQTITEIAAENNSTTIFPIPIELIKPFLSGSATRSDSSAETPAALPAPNPLLSGLPQLTKETKPAEPAEPKE